MKLRQLFENAESILKQFEDFLHHIAEEELIACKVFSMKATDPNTIAVIADCNDNVRKAGYQEDLSKKLNARLSLHPQLALIDARVYHKNIDPR